MNQLSQDEIVTLLLKSNLPEIQRLCSTNKQIALVCSTDYVWQQLVQRDFGPQVENVANNWHITYRILNRQFYQVIHDIDNGREHKTETFWSKASAMNFIIDNIGPNIGLFASPTLIQTNDIPADLLDLFEDGESRELNDIWNTPIAQRYIQRAQKSIVDILNNVATIRTINNDEGYTLVKQKFRY